MMALANLLEHPEIKSDAMISLFAGCWIKRSDKDLGRVLAITTLSHLPERLAGLPTTVVGSLARRGKSFAG